MESRLRRSSSVVPAETGHETYLVLDDLGHLGRVWRETNEVDANHDALIRELLDDQYSRPTRIVASNTTEGWSRDSPWMSPTSYADASPTTMTCRFPWSSYWRWQGAKEPRVVALGGNSPASFCPDNRRAKASIHGRWKKGGS